MQYVCLSYSVAVVSVKHDLCAKVLGCRVENAERETHHDSRNEQFVRGYVK